MNQKETVKMNYVVSYDKTTESVLDGLSKPLQVAKAGEYLVCAELILQGYNAILADAGSPYDILVELSNVKFIKIQVKSTCKLYNRNTCSKRKNTPASYRYDRKKIGKKIEKIRRRRKCFELISLM
ncbi:MAG: hypothetical protein HC836_37260 [Richelia sp. RM2_1_2]|nr:hypothetical protein [Richelia sp. RM2_1_2]